MGEQQSDRKLKMENIILDKCENFNKEQKRERASEVKKKRRSFTIYNHELSTKCSTQKLRRVLFTLKSQSQLAHNRRLSRCLKQPVSLRAIHVWHACFPFGAVQNWDLIPKCVHLSTHEIYVCIYKPRKNLFSSLFILKTNFFSRKSFLHSNPLLKSSRYELREKKN